MSPNERRPQHEAGGERNDLGGLWSSVRPGPPCGCLNIGQCVHIDHDAPRLREPAELGPRCSGRDRFACLALGIPEREAMGRHGMCCADLLAGVAS